MNKKGDLRLGNVTGVAAALIVGALFIASGHPWWGGLFIIVGIIVAFLIGKD